MWLVWLCVVIRHSLITQLKVLCHFGIDWLLPSHTIERVSCLERSVGLLSQAVQSADSRGSHLDIRLCLCIGLDEGWPSGGVGRRERGGRGVAIATDCSIFGCAMC